MDSRFFNYPVLFILWALVVSCDQPPTIKTITVTPDQLWIESNLIISKADEEKAADIMVDIEKPLQFIDGFGACFNELGWDVLALRNPDREMVIITANLTGEERQKIISIGERDIEASLAAEAIIAFLVPPVV